MWLPGSASGRRGEGRGVCSDNQVLTSHCLLCVLLETIKEQYEKVLDFKDVIIFEERSLFAL